MTVSPHRIGSYLVAVLSRGPGVSSRILLIWAVSSLASFSLGAVMHTTDPLGFDIPTSIQVLALAAAVLFLAGVGSLDVIRRIRRAGVGEGKPQTEAITALVDGLRADSTWRGEVTAALAALMDTSREMARALQEHRGAILSDAQQTRHNVEVPTLNAARELVRRTEGVEFLIRDFQTVKEQVDDLSRRARS